MLVNADFDPAPIDIRRAIDAGRKIDPRRHLRSGEPRVARRRAEVHHDLPRGTDAVSQQCLEHRRKPGTTGEHEPVSGDLQTFARTKPIDVRCRGRVDTRGDNRDASLLEIASERAHRPACRHDAAVALEQRHVDTLEVELRETPGHLAGRRPQAGCRADSKCPACRTYTSRFRRHPQDARRMPQRSWTPRRSLSARHCSRDRRASSE